MKIRFETGDAPRLDPTSLVLIAVGILHGASPDLMR